MLRAMESAPVIAGSVDWAHTSPPLPAARPRASGRGPGPYAVLGAASRQPLDRQLAGARIPAPVGAASPRRPIQHRFPARGRPVWPTGVCPWPSRPICGLRANLGADRPADGTTRWTVAHRLSSLCNPFFALFVGRHLPATQSGGQPPASPSAALRGVEAIRPPAATRTGHTRACWANPAVSIASPLPTIDNCDRASETALISARSGQNRRSGAVRDLASWRDPEPVAQDHEPHGGHTSDTGEGGV